MASASPPGSIAAPFQLRSLIGPVYLPNFLYSMGAGLVLPITPLFAKELGASVGTISLIVTFGAIGGISANVPAGVAIDRQPPTRAW